jgi:dTDP-4-dehydrorhamnose 3,5-epimerase-like enzyme
MGEDEVVTDEAMHHAPKTRPTGLPGVLLVTLPVVSYNDSRLTEAHRVGWEGLFDERIDHLYWVVTRAGVQRQWGRHDFTVDRYAAVSGLIEVALVDDRPESAARSRSLLVQLDATTGDGLVIPPGVWHTFRAVTPEAVLLNSKSPPYGARGVDKQTLPMPNELFEDDWDSLSAERDSARG